MATHGMVTGTAHVLAEMIGRARGAYATRLAEGGRSAAPWWTAVIVTASSSRQAEYYAQQLRWRQAQGCLPDGALYLAVPDLRDQRIGSGGATLNALRVLAESSLPVSGVADLETWWRDQRVLIIHSGGDSRRLPQYSMSGKLFCPLPVRTPWGDVSTVFDETMALSTLWADRLPAGLVVASGDALLLFDDAGLRWDRPLVSAVAICQPVAVGVQHGIYLPDAAGRVQGFLQKPTVADVRDAGGLLSDDQVALDSGLLRFDPPVAARLTELAGARRLDRGWEVGAGILDDAGSGIPCLDLYEQIVLSITGAWEPAPDAPPAWHLLARALRDIPFWCDVVEGEFIHAGTSRLFRRIMTEETTLSGLYRRQQRLDITAPPLVNSAGVIIDSVFAAGGELDAQALVVECEFTLPVRAGRGAVLHGLSGLACTVEVPDDTVVHQLPVVLPDGRRQAVIRVYAIDDNPKDRVQDSPALWLGRPLLERLETLGIDPEAVWPDVPLAERTLWNARLFPVGEPADLWECVRWMTGFHTGYAVADWARSERLSLAASARWADLDALAHARLRRRDATWMSTALSLSLSGTDIRPLLATSSRIPTLAATGRELWTKAAIRKCSAPTEAASLFTHASQLFTQAGLVEEAERARGMAFACVHHAVDAGICAMGSLPDAARYQVDRVEVKAPARVDLGGGWSDTPPFCHDWGGTVLNIAVALEGDYPIMTTVQRLDVPLVRCVSEQTGEVAEYRTAEELFAPPATGCPFTIPRTALRMCRLVRPGETLAAALEARGGGLETRTDVRLPMGSGLGTSSIVAATMVRALAGLFGQPMSDHALTDQVMWLEQLMTTGGGWQDQAGGIFPGAKLVTSGPGMRQRLRVHPVPWSAERQREFAERFVLYDTGIRRVAKNILAQVVGSYLAREVATIQILHSIKTLATEMMYAMVEGEWTYLGQLMQRHWDSNQTLDPHTTNVLINSLLQEAQPYLAGAKLAGAGGGGFMLMLAKDPGAAHDLRARLSAGDLPGRVVRYAIATEGLQVLTA